MHRFDNDVRAALFSAGVIALNDDGETTFTGLTASETRFVMDYDLAQAQQNSGEHRRFQQLVQKFEAAREAVIQDAQQLAIQQLGQFRVAGGAVQTRISTQGKSSATDTR